MTKPKFWAVLPAAGLGQRMGADAPKQYLELAGRPMIEHSLERMLQHPLIEGLVVALAPSDHRWSLTAFAQHPDVHHVLGGAQRADSVLNALSWLRRRAAPDDWVLVHDVARPCVRRRDVSYLIERVGSHPVGGLLGVPARDTMKRTDASGLITVTVERHLLWHAFTPQMFRLGLLLAALQSVKSSGQAVTDEAGAVEFAGHRPLLVQGCSDNIKITRPEDLELAAYYLRCQAADNDFWGSTG